MKFQLLHRAGVAALVAALSLAGLPASAQNGPPPGQADTRAEAPAKGRLNFWGPSEQLRYYKAMETVFPTHVIKAGDKVHPLPVDANPLKVSFSHKSRPYTLEDFQDISRASGLLVIHKGRIVLERYAHGRGPNDRWTSFSIAKSVTSTLLGAAIRDGAIKSLDDPVSRYVPELKGGAFEGVTLRHLATMTSGVRFTEDYGDPSSDFSRFTTGTGPSFFQLMSNMPREHAAGAHYHYSTADSNLLGAAVQRATGKSLSDYLSEKIWKPFGMEQDGVWMVSDEGMETGGICFSATLRDYGRFGLFILNGGVAGGKEVLPKGFLQEATTKRVGTSYPGLDYGYQWWVRQGGVYQGIGIMGQSLYVVPEQELIIVQQSAWTTSGSADDYALQASFVEGVREAIRRRG